MKLTKNKPLRGFIHLVGETVLKIDASAINVVIITCLSGKVIELDCDSQTSYGIGIICCTEKT